MQANKGLDAQSFLTDVAAKWIRGARLRDSDWLALIELAKDRREKIRERALTLLLQPPVQGNLDHQQQLFRAVSRARKLGADLPPALLEMVCDWVSFLDCFPGELMDSELDGWLRTLPGALWLSLRRRAISISPFLPALKLHYMLGGKNLPTRVEKSKWRLLRRRLKSLSRKDVSTTFLDLARLWQCPGGMSRRRFHRGRWLSIGRHVSSRSEARSTGGPALDIMKSALGQSRSRYLTALFTRQAEELSAVQDLAVAASRASRRVVLSWHNATLAAAGGWGFQSLREQFADPRLWMEFRERVASLEREMRPDCGELGAEAERLWKQWDRRLIHPKLTHSLWESHLRAKMHKSWKDRLQRDLALVEPIVGKAEIEAALKEEKWVWSGALNPAQYWSVSAVLRWRGERERIWSRGLTRLRAMIFAGQEMLTAGSLDALVLPWIDKFFISSLRTGDRSYLPALIDWLCASFANPLILFWEDTAHATNPSFGLALEAMSRPDWRGIGIFSKDGSRRRDALEIISRCHANCRLFALRPCSDVHNPTSLDKLLDTRDHDFFKRYDSSWKDNCACLYSGTQVEPLLSIQSDIESLPSWVSHHGKRIPFGTFFRSILREQVFGPPPQTVLHQGTLRDDLQRSYEHWAQLC